MAKKKDQKWMVSDGSDTFTVTRKGTGQWGCDCPATDMCKHIKIAKLQRELLKVQGKLKKSKPKKKAEKIVYHFHHLAAKLKEMLLTMQLQDIPATSWEYKNTERMIDRRNYLVGSSNREWYAIVDKFRQILPGLTKKRLREIKNELGTQRLERDSKNRQLVYQQDKEKEQFPERLLNSQVKDVLFKKLKRVLGDDLILEDTPEVLPGDDVVPEASANRLMKENRMLHYNSMRIYYGITDRKKVVVWFSDPGF